GYSRAIVALTAHAMDSDRQKCVDAGCNDFAVKPIEREKLIAVLAKFLRQVNAGTVPVSLAPGVEPDPAEPAALTANSQLNALLSKPGTARLVETFLARLDDRVSAIRSAAEAQDRALLKDLAHQLKGAAGGYGFPQISERAKILEQAAMQSFEAEQLAREIR